MPEQDLVHSKLPIGSPLLWAVFSKIVIHSKRPWIENPPQTKSVVRSTSTKRDDREKLVVIAKTRGLSMHGEEDLR